MDAALGLWLVLGAIASPADAIDASWDAPAGCPDREALLARMRARIGPDAAGPATVRGTVRAAATGYALSLELAIAGSSTQRELAAATCDELVDAAALIVAVALDPIFAVEAPAIADVIEPPAPRSAPIRSAPAPAPIVPIVRRRPTMRTLGLGLRPVVGVWFGAVPRPAATVGFDLVLPARRSLRAELGVLAIPRQRVDVTADAGATLWLATAVLRACFAPAIGRVRPMGCAGIAAGAIGGTGTGNVRRESKAQPWAAVTAGAGVGIALARRFEIVVRGEGHVHLHQPGFHLKNVGPVHRVGATSVTALAGLQAVLP